MKNCPICGHEVEAYHELRQSEPYIHTNPFDGLMIYGAYSAPKETICYENNFLHFAFYDSEGNLVDHRLVQLNHPWPETKSPSDEYLEAMYSAEDSLNEDGSGINYDSPNRFSEVEEDKFYNDLFKNDDDDLPF